MSFLSFFHEILIVSLINDSKRRSRVTQTLTDERFVWVDGISADSSDVKEAYIRDRVHSHVTCFRHGPNCNKLNCQNVLIPSQIATWMSHKKAISRVAEGLVEIPSLVLEDDFVLMSYTEVIDADVQKLLEIEFSRAKDPVLMKLGWKKGPGHRVGPKSMVTAKEDSATMSNPAYALNPRAAELLLDNWPTKYRHTVDTWIHRDMAPLLKSKKIDPPVFAERSSVIDFGFEPSLIHPKMPSKLALVSGKISFPQYLTERKRFEGHKASVKHREILCVGHPRTGSGFIAAVFEKHCGLSVGHEEMKEAGISTWMFAGKSWEVPFGRNEYAKFPRLSRFDIVFNFVRDPWTALPSVLRELRYSPEAYHFLREEILAGLGVDLESFSNEADRAVASLRLWNTLCVERFPNSIPVRIEKLSEDLRESGVGERYLPTGNIGTLGKVNANKKYQHRRYSAPSSQSVHRELTKVGKAHLRHYADYYCYDIGTRVEASEQTPKKS